MFDEPEVLLDHLGACSDQGNGEPRYTVVEHYHKTVLDGVNRPATEKVPPGERPAVWFSIHPDWEPTATKALRDRDTGKVYRAAWTDMPQRGPAQIEVGRRRRRTDAIPYLYGSMPPMRRRD